MTSSTFQPYGLITNPLQEGLYFRAHIANVYTGIANPKEYETSALVGEILTSEFKSSENFTVSCQYPPAPQSSLRVDYVVRYLEQNSFKIKILLIDEDKRAKTSQAFSLKALEDQAAKYCKVCLNSDTEMQFVYAITAAGAHLRLWKYTGGHGLSPLWGTDSIGDWSQYKDVGKDEDAQEIKYRFGQMKLYPPTPHAGQTSHTYGGVNYQASSASASYQVPISSANYTVPIFQTDPASVHTEIGGEQTSSPSEEASLGEASGKDYLPVEAIQVEVMVEPRKNGGDLYHFYHNDVHHKVDEGNWLAYMKEDNNGKHWDCVACWDFGLCFYTWDLNQAQPYTDASRPEASASDYQAPAPTQALDSSGQDTQQFVVVTIRVEKHSTSKDEILFKNKKGYTVKTLRKDWEAIKCDGKPAWQHETKHHTYITFDKRVD